MGSRVSCPGQEGRKEGWLRGCLRRRRSLNVYYYERARGDSRGRLSGYGWLSEERKSERASERYTTAENSWKG